MGYWSDQIKQSRSSTPAGSMDGLNTRLAAILNSPDVSEEDKAKAIKDAKGEDSSSGIGSILSGGGDLLGKALKLIDTPRSVVENSLVEGAKLAKNAVDPGSYTGDDTPNAENLWKAIGDHRSGAEILDKNELTTNLNPWVKGVAGFAADVGADPLTYLGGAGALEELGSKGVSQAAFGAARATEDVELATKLNAIGQKANKGTALLSQEERSVLGEAIGKDLSGGVAAKNPLSVLGIGPKEATIVKGSDALSAIPKGLRSGEETVRASKVGQMVGKSLGGNEAMHALEQVARRSEDPQMAAWASGMQDAIRTGSSQARPYVEAIAKNYTELLGEAKKAGVSMEDAWDVLGVFDGQNLAEAMANPAVARMEEKAPGLVEKLRAHDDLVHNTMQAAGVDIAYRELHAPSGVTQEFKDLLAGGKQDVKPNASNPFFPGANEQKAHVVPGGRFMDEYLAHPTHPIEIAQEDGTILKLAPDAEGRSAAEQAQAIADKKYGDKSIPIFNKDWEANAQKQISSAGRRIQARQIEKLAEEKGILTQQFADVLDPESAAKVLAKGKAEKLKDVLAKVTGSAAHADAQAGLDEADKVGRISTGIDQAEQLQQVAQGQADTALANAPVTGALEDATKATAEAEGRMGALTDLKAEDDARLARGEDALRVRDDKITQIAAKGQREQELHEIVSTLQETKGVVTPERKALIEEVRARLDEEGAQLVEMRAAHEELAGRAADNTNLVAQKVDSEKALAAAEKRQASGMRLLNEEDPQTSKVMKDTLDELEQVKQEKAQIAGKDREVAYIGELQKNLPEPDANGALLHPDYAKANGQDIPTNEYYAGTSGTVVTSGFEGGSASGQGNYDTWDNLLGNQHWTPDPNEAAGYSRRSIAKNPNAKNLQDRIAVAELHVKNPFKVGDVDQLINEGHGAVEGYHPVQDAMVAKAIDDGTITSDHLFEASQFAEGDEYVNQDFAEAFGVAEDHMAAGVPQDVAIDRAFAGSDSIGEAASTDGVPDFPYAEFTYDELLAHGHSEAEADELLRPVSAEVRTRAAKALSAIDSEIPQQAADVWKQGLIDQGHDAIMYPLGVPPKWAVVPMDGNAVVSKGAEFTRNGDVFTQPSSKRTITVDTYKGAQDVTVGRSKGVIFDSRDNLAMQKKLMAKQAKEALEANPIHQALPGAMDSQSVRVRDSRKLQKSLLKEQKALRAELEQPVETLKGVQRELKVQREASIQKSLDLMDEGNALRHKAVTAIKELGQQEGQIGESLDREAFTKIHNQAAVDNALSGVAYMEASAEATKNTIENVAKMQTTNEAFLKSIGDPQLEYSQQRMIVDGFKNSGQYTQGPEQMVDAMHDFMKLGDPKQRGIFLKAYDSLTHVFKAYAILTPGFHVRNALGGSFNNWLAGVEIASYGRFLKADSRYTKALAENLTHEEALLRVPLRDREAFSQALDSGLLSQHGQATSLAQEAGTAPAHGMKEIIHGQPGEGNSFTNHPLTRANYAGSEKVERMLRGTLAFDQLSKGKSIDEAVGAVAKYHFDYGDLSKFETSTMKRINPFYTWTRKNLPLQLEMFAKQPEKYVRYYQLKNNMEAAAGPEDGVVPSYFGEQLGIHLPGNIGGNSLYLMPDLPFKDLGKTGWREWASQLNPVAKAPLEMIGGRQWFSDVPFKDGPQAIPSSWDALGVGKALQAIGLAEPAKDGTLMASDKTLYAIEQYLPFMARVRRQLPSEAKYQDRAALTTVNMLFGAGLRANTPADQNGELYRRTKTLDSLAQSLGNRGYGGYYLSSTPRAVDHRTVDGKAVPPLKANATQKERIAYMLKYGSS